MLPVNPDPAVCPAERTTGGYSLGSLRFDSSCRSTSPKTQELVARHLANNKRDPSLIPESRIDQAFKLNH